MLTVGSLFSGIGGFELGLERAGMRVVWQSEIDPYASAVLRKHWPDVPNHGDVRSIRAGVVEPVDVICGGFPCQPFSTAARGRNNAADLWPEMLRVVRDLRACWVVAENVPGFGLDGVDRICADLEREGYTVWPLDVDVAPLGRQRARRRFIFLAYANREGESRRAVNAEVASVPRVSEHGAEDDAAPMGVDDGLPARMDRLARLGNALPPWIAEVIGRAIVAAHL